jgi:hypothetical protein
MFPKQVKNKLKIVYDDVAWKFADPEQMQILEQAAPVQEI